MLHQSPGGLIDPRVSLPICGGLDQPEFVASPPRLRQRNGFGSSSFEPPFHLPSARTPRVPVRSLAKFAPAFHGPVWRQQAFAARHRPAEIAALTLRGLP